MQVCCLIEADAGCYTPVPLIADATLPTPVVTITEPLRETAAVGVNLTLTVQLAPAASEDGQVVETKLKSVPLTDTVLGAVILLQIHAWRLAVEGAQILADPYFWLSALVAAGLRLWA